MSNLCEKLLNQDIVASCNNPVFAGMNSRSYIFNKSEVELTYDETGVVITDIDMKTYGEGSEETTAVGYKVIQLGKQPYEGTTSSLVEGSVMNKFDHTVQFIVADNSPEAAGILNNIKDGKFVMVCQNDYTGSDGRGEWQAYGCKKGLSCTAMERDAYGDNDGAWVVTLVESGSPMSAIFVEHKNASQEVDTAEYLEGLCED